MNHQTIARTAAALVAASLLIAGSAWAADPVSKCEASKLKARAKRVDCLHKAQAKAALGKALDLVKCETKFSDSLSKADDKASSAGVSCRYMDNGDLTTTDLDTGNMWERKTVGNVDDEWTWLDALQHIHGRSDGTSVFSGVAGDIQGLGGHFDWRMPTHIELQGITDCSFGNPCADPALGPTATGSLGDTVYLSSTTWSDNPTTARVVRFADGIFAASPKISLNKFRAVRDGLYRVAASAPAVSGDTNVAKCQAGKLKAWGKRRSCELKAQAKARVKATIPSFAKCVQKFTDQMAKADEKSSKAGVTCRFFDNGNGTVSDLDTSLMWEMKTGGNFDDLVPWADGTTVGVFINVHGSSPDEVTQPAGPLSGLGGHFDWRTPSTAELLGLIDCSFGSPCLAPGFGPVSPFLAYWSANIDDGVPSDAWAVNLVTGLPVSVGAFDPLIVAAWRGVRGGS